MSLSLDLKYDFEPCTGGYLPIKLLACLLARSLACLLHLTVVLSKVAG